MPRFNVLGSLHVVHDGRVTSPSPPKVRRVLALLVVRANQIVHPDAFIEELWGPAPPKSAITTLQTYIYHLRKIFAAEGLNPPGEELLVTHNPGYVLRLPRNSIDAEVFERLVLDGRDHLDRECPGRAASVLHEALRLWSGPALANVTRGRTLDAHAVRLEEYRTYALQLRIEADLRLGHHHELIAELRSLTEAHPLNEWFSGHLIMALADAGRRDESLTVYRRTRAVLRSELGLDPSDELKRVLQRVLNPDQPEPDRRRLQAAPLGRPRVPDQRRSSPLAITARPA